MKIHDTIVLKKGRDASLRRLHPWIFSGAIGTVNQSAKDGQWVRVKDAAGKVIGYGHFQKGSIAVRMLLFGDEEPDESFYINKIRKAYQQREVSGILQDGTNCFRLIHGEGDGLPGLIIDWYDGTAVMQAHSNGMHEDRILISEALREVLKSNLHSVYYKSPSVNAGKNENEYLLGMSAVPHMVMENGNKFLVDWEEGQKTGFFLDQRENRDLAGKMASGRSVLNTFAYTGGFSVYALKGGATLVHSVDVSGKAIEMARRNIEANGFDPIQHACYAEDVFDFMKDKKEKYDYIILDPPAFAKHKDARHQAMKGYQRLNAEAMRIISPGGLLFTFSCSQVVDRQLFYDTIVSSGIQSGRTIKVLQQLSQPADHPVSLFHPEGEYLKGLLLYVE